MHTLPPAGAHKKAKMMRPFLLMGQQPKEAQRVYLRKAVFGKII
jgi:hypothetical protein